MMEFYRNIVKRVGQNWDRFSTNIRNDWEKIKKEQADAQKSKEKHKPRLDTLTSSDDILSESYRKFQNKIITMGEYIDIINSEKNRIAECKEYLKSMKRSKYHDAEYYNFLKDILDKNIEAVEWRLKWAKKKNWISNNVESHFLDIPANGNWMRFDYTDLDGKKSNRNITMWQKRGIAVVGYDKKAGGERTFRMVGMKNVKLG